MFQNVRIGVIFILACYCPLLMAELPVTIGLVMHLDADSITGTSNGSPIATWKGLVGSGMDATQATSTKQPVYDAANPAFNGQPTVHFDGSNDYMFLPSGADCPIHVGSFTLFIAAKFDVSGVSQWAVSAQGTGGDDRLRISIEGAIGGAPFHWRIGSTDWPGNINTAADTAAHIFGAASGGGTAEGFLDGVSVGTAPNSSSLQPSDFGLGAGNLANPNSFLNGDIAEFLVYNRKLNATEIDQVNDYLEAKYIPLPSPISPADRVIGNMMLINENAGWCWYQDEKIIYDPVGNAVITSTTNDNSGFDGPARQADIDATTFNIATGLRTRAIMANIYSYSSGDDHNVGALWIRPDGRYLHMCGGHNINDNSYYRTTINPNDGSSWSAESYFNWETISGLSDGDNLSYHNLHYLSAEGTGNGRLYNISREFDRSPNIAYSDDWGQTWAYAGKLSLPKTGTSYSNGYFKFTSNGVDRIDFIATEHHPYDYNNSIYHGYIQGGKSYNSYGTEIDNSIFDETAPGPEEFTPVFLSGPVVTGQYHTAWTVELERDANGYPVCLFITRYGTDSYGGEVGAMDHRLFYGRFDGASWTITELGRMGPGLGPETDYTGLGCIHPENHNLVYISTLFDPRDDTKLGNYEIFKGVSDDDGATWQWTQITIDSTVDNLRPAVPSWDANNTALFWLRGYAPAGGGNPAQNFDEALVGVIDRHDERYSLVTYIDANQSNTTEADNSPFTPTDPSGSPGVGDDQWHEFTEYGNEGSCYTSNESPEDAPMLKTTISGMSDGTYDVFAYFWCGPSENWGVAGGFSTSDILYFNRQSSQHTEESDFLGSVSVIDFDVMLYRIYIGRRQVTGGAAIDVYIDDHDDSLVNGANRTTYDGVGVARVIPNYDGDLSRDGKVDFKDLAILGQGWQTIYDINTLDDITNDWLLGVYN